MPTYQYKCRNCNHEFEEFQPMSASPVVTCPECKTDNLVRLIGAGAGMIFKGSGFYSTDYKNTKSEPKESTPKPSGNKPPSVEKPGDKEQKK